MELRAVTESFAAEIGDIDLSKKLSAADEAADALCPGGLTRVLKDHVNAPLAREAFHLFEKICLRVIDDFVCAKLSGFFEFFRRASRRKDARAEQAAYLDGGRSHSAPRSMHKHSLART